MKRARKRRYVLRVRGERQAETRARIVEAIMRLHEEVGPRYTTVSAIAERAGVERLTVYRHFRNEADMYSACSQRHMDLHPPPQATTWAGERDPASRTRRGLADIYAYFSRTADMLEKIYRDADHHAAIRGLLDGFDAHLRTLADDLAASWPRDKGHARRALILRHAVKFSTWRSFHADAVSNDAKIELMLAWLKAAS